MFFFCLILLRLSVLLRLNPFRKYLSSAPAGNVIEKAERIEEWLKENPDHAIVRESLDALKASIPEPIAFEDLDFNFGERWIPTGVYSAYMSHLFNTQVSIVYSDSMDEYSAKCSMKTMAITDEYMVKGILPPL